MKANRKLRKPDPSSKLVLKEVIGLTAKNANGLTSSASTSKCVYVAGCVVVVYDVESGTQSHLMVSHRTPKPLSCVAVSRDGRFVAAGESGHQPAVIVWDSVRHAFVSELKGHLYGIECIAFSPDGEHLVSVGGYIYLWDWRSGMLVSKLKASSSCSAVVSVTFSSDAKFVITAGQKHLKFWTLGSSPRNRINKGTISLAMNGKPINLGPQKGSSFLSVASSVWADNSVVSHGQAAELFPIYALTDAGVLCLIDSGLSVGKSVDLKVERGFALSTSSELIACACNSGVVQLFTVESLNYAGSLFYSKAKKCQEESDLVCFKDGEKNLQHPFPLPDAVACQFSTSRKLVVVYGDHSLYIWDILDVKEATRCCVLVSHSACIMDIKNLCCENMHDSSLACAARGCSGGVSFATCSADGSIRLWDLVLPPDLSEDAVSSNSLITELVGSMCLVSAGIFECGTIETNFSNPGFRALAVSSDGKYMAVGDCEGNLHIYDLYNSDYTCIKDAHDAEILSLSFSLPSKKDVNSGEAVDHHYLLASGGRDRIIHLFDAKRNFDLIGSIDDHSAAVTSVKLTSNGCKILSCSADRSLVFRDISIQHGACKVLRRHQQMASNGTVYDMSMDATMEIVVTVGQDKKINTYGIAAGKLIRSFKQDKDFGDPIKVTMDPSCTYLVCSYSNKSICIYDYVTGEMIAQATGHGEVVTGVIFLPDCKHIVSVGGDGCIFVWKLPARLASRILEQVKENLIPLSPRNLAQPVPFSQILFCEEEDQPNRIYSKDACLLEKSSQVGQRGDSYETSFKFSISRLPKWAQAKVTNRDLSPRNLELPLSEEQVELKVLSPLIGNGEDYDFMRPEDQTPSNHVSRCRKSCLTSLSSSATSQSLSSASPPESSRDNRWLTIYNVCVDLLTTPEMQSLEGVKMPVSSLCSLQEQTELPSESDGSHSFGQGGNVIVDGLAATSKLAFPDNIGCLSSDHDQLGVQYNVCCEEVLDVTGRLHSDRAEGLETTENNASEITSEDSELFTEHFGSLSTVFKVEKRKSSVQRRYSSQYFVRRDYLGGCKRLFETPLRNRTLLDHEKESAHSVTLDAPGIQIFKNLQAIDSNKQDLNSLESLICPVISRNDPNESDKCAVDENSPKIELPNGRDQKECCPRGSKVNEKIAECREALLKLDTAAENVFKLFSKLGTAGSAEELLSGPAAAQLYDQATERLPSIAEKVHLVALMLQNTNDNSSKSRVENSRFKI